MTVPEFTPEGAMWRTTRRAKVLMFARWSSGSSQPEFYDGNLPGRQWRSNRNSLWSPESFDRDIWWERISKAPAAACAEPKHGVTPSDAKGIAAFVTPPEPPAPELPKPARVSTLNRAWRWL